MAPMMRTLLELGVWHRWNRHRKRPIPTEAGFAELPDEDEKHLLGALIVISTGVEDMTKLNVPVEVGRRLLDCYDDFRKGEA